MKWRILARPVGAFMNYDLDPYQVAEDLLGMNGRMLSATKQAPEEKRVVWNGNVVVGPKVPMKIWFGDISITDQEAKLQELADTLEATVYVLREMDARFDGIKLDDPRATFKPQKS